MSETPCCPAIQTGLGKPRAAIAKGEWRLTVRLFVDGKHQAGFDQELSYSDSFVVGWHHSHLGMALQTFMSEVGERFKKLRRRRK